MSNVFLNTNEILAFNFFSSKAEVESNPFRPEIFSFLKAYAPEKLRMLKRILKRIGFNFSGPLFADLLMPGNVGGYFSPDQGIMAINPMLLLYGSEQEIAHVLFHESLHADGLMDEVLVETLTKKRMQEVYGGKEFKSGYDGLVNEASEFFGDLSFNEIQELVEDKDDEDAFNNILELVVVRPSLGNVDIKSLKWDEIQKLLKKKWSMLQRFFPRMINSIAKNGAGLHDAAQMNAYEFKLEGLLENAARKIFGEKQEILTDILINLTEDKAGVLTTEDVIDMFREEGYGYIADQEPKFLQKYISEFLIQRAFNQFLKKDMIAENFVINVV